MFPYFASSRFSLPEWVYRTLMLCGPGRPFALTPDELARGLSLCPATGQALMHAQAASAWTWSEIDAI